MVKTEFSLQPVQKSDETIQIEGEHYQKEDIRQHGIAVWEHHTSSLPELAESMSKLRHGGIGGQIAETYMEIGYFHSMLRGDAMARATATIAIEQCEEVLHQMIGSLLKDNV